MCPAMFATEGGQEIKMCFVLAGMGCLFNSQGVGKSKMAYRSGKRMLVCTSPLESESEFC